MGGTSSLDLMTRQFESGMPRLVLQSASLWRGTLVMCGQLLTLPMGGTSSLDPQTRQFESGMPRLDAVGKPLEGHTDRVRSVAYSPDGQHIISGSDDKTIRIWNAETGSAVGKPLEGHTHWVRSVAYSPDGRHIISGSSDRQFESGMPRLALQSASL
jgi:WD40 repeat protein